jgi:hypothetical protein
MDEERIDRLDQLHFIWNMKGNPRKYLLWCILASSRRFLTDDRCCGTFIA